MSKFEKSFYKLISYSRSKLTLNIFNFVTNTEDSIYILPYLPAVFGYNFSGLNSL